MALEAPPRPPRAHVTLMERTASRSEPPRPSSSPLSAAPEAEWVGIPAPLGISSPPPPADSAVLTPGLARLLNAALFDAGFEALFRRTPTLAALRATAEAGETGALFGATLPDPALRLSLPPLSDADWAVLRRMPPTESLAQAAREMRRLVRLADHAAPQELPQVAAHAAPASHEGALAGAA